MSEVEYNEKLFKKLAGDGEAEFCNYMPRGTTGMRKWEIKVRYDDGSCKIVVISDSGFNITGKVIEINPVTTRKERNAEIIRFYNEEGLSQVFLGNLFNVSQPTVSIIVKQNND